MWIAAGLLALALISIISKKIPRIPKNRSKTFTVWLRV
jgi:hypothetical protein